MFGQFGFASSVSKHIRAQMIHLLPSVKQSNDEHQLKAFKQCIHLENGQLDVVNDKYDNDVF